MQRKRKYIPKYKPYLHITNKIEIYKNNSIDKNIVGKLNDFLKNKEKIAKHAFFPLLYRQMKERKVRPKTNQEQIETSSNKVFYKNKPRPIHYATHIDAHIYAKYSHILSTEYENYLEKEENSTLSKLITGYRSVENEEYKTNNRAFRNKNSVLFANEIFEEIKRREECVILTFDIEKFFSSLDHSKLKEAWLNFIPFSKNEEKPKTLPTDHYNVFKSIVNFHYIKLDDLRINNKGFDEKKLHEIRQEGGSSFFHSVEEFRNLIKNGKLRVYNNQFRHKKKEKEKDEKEEGRKEKEGNEKRVKCGIPQGLPISATLSNIYMLEFDKWVLEHLVKAKEVFYRRYSDDMIFICTEANYKKIQEEVEKQIEQDICNLTISKKKTEIFLYKNKTITKQPNPHNGDNDIAHKNSPLRYLGLEFDGKNIRVKSASISKYYRRMKKAIKAKERIVRRLREQGQEDAEIFKKQLYKAFYRESNTKKKGGKKKHGNYIRYIKKTSYQIYQTDNETVVTNQMKSHKEIFKRELKNAEDRLNKDKKE